jgi:hypothetical protein
MGMQTSSSKAIKKVKQRTNQMVSASNATKSRQGFCGRCSDYDLGCQPCRGVLYHDGESAVNRRTLALTDTDLRRQYRANRNLR